MTISEIESSWAGVGEPKDENGYHPMPATFRNRANPSEPRWVFPNCLILRRLQARFRSVKIARLGACLDGIPERLVCGFRSNRGYTENR